MTGINFITIERIVPGAAPDTSTFSIYERKPGHAETLGALPHTTRWRPATERDRDALVSWLDSLRYD